MRTLMAIMIIISLFSCINRESDINKLIPEYTSVYDEELAFNGSLLYSDSARLTVKVDYKELRKFVEDNRSYTEFPKGIFATFYNDDEKEISWLSANYAIRDEQNEIMTVQDSVVLYNIDQDKLVTSELIWEEKTQLITTNKYVRITQPMRGDTSYGYGLEAKQDFSEFQIGKFSGKGTIEGLK